MKIKKRLLFFAMFLMLATIFSYAEVKVEKHWTPYNPPMSYPDGTNVYIIQKGDTLWDLAGKYLNNSYLWPKIWEKNKYIKDPHWIYPGDPLVITKVETVATAQQTANKPEKEVKQFEEQEAKEVKQPEEKKTIITNPKPKEEAKVEEAASESDIKNALYSITVNSKKDYESTAFLGKVVEGSEDEQINFGVPGSTIYVKEFANGNLGANDVYTVVRPVKFVKLEKDKYIVILQRLADVKVLCVNDGIATTKFVYSSHPVKRGDFLVKSNYEPIPLLVDYKPKTGYCQAPDSNRFDVLYFKDNTPHTGQGGMVVIKAGKQANLSAGDIVQFYRKLKHIDKDVYLGEGVVLFSNEYTSTVKVVYSEREMPIESTFAVKR